MEPDLSGLSMRQGSKEPSSVATGVGKTDLGSVVTELKPQNLTHRHLVCGREKRRPVCDGAVNRCDYMETSRVSPKADRPKRRREILPLP